MYNHVISRFNECFYNGKLTIHGVDGLKGHDLRFAGVSLLQQLSEMGHVIVAENEFLSPTVPDTLDH